MLRHITWDINNFATRSRTKEGDIVTFEDDAKGKIIVGNVKLGTYPLIENVILVDGLKYNLLSVSQLCDKGFNVIFDDLACS